MDKANIILFVGLSLCKYRMITVGGIQQFIKSRPEVGKIIDPERIQETLEDLEYVGFVQHVDYGEEVYWSKYSDNQN